MKPILLLQLLLITFFSFTWKNNEYSKFSILNEKTEIEYYKTLIDRFPFTKYLSEKKNLGIKEKLNLTLLNHLPKEIVKNIENQYNKTNKPNFANQYILISWSCGSPCQMHVIVDFNSGKLILFINSSIGINFKAESNLLIINPPTNEIYDEDFRNIIGKPRFYIFKNDSLIELYNN